MCSQIEHNETFGKHMMSLVPLVDRVLSRHQQGIHIAAKVGISFACEGDDVVAQSACREASFTIITVHPKKN